MGTITEIAQPKNKQNYDEYFLSDGITMALNSSRVVISELHQMSSDLFEPQSFVLSMIDFSLLFSSFQLPKQHAVISLSELEDQWEEIKINFRLINNKTPELKDAWKSFSVMVSQYFASQHLLTTP
ncbi:MAG: hypothetical protein ISQ13_05330 [Candidatus Margulisbacteria bacterium]|jgi:hypothetical protein|nr:hypothetical protein [Candidatus Margulisiibacteriota bacterium]